MKKIMLFMFVCAFSVGAMACDGSKAKSKTQSDVKIKDKTGRTL